MNKPGIGIIEILIPILITLAAASIGIGYSLWSKKPDNVIEELCEEVIKKQTGFDIDLSPDSPE